MNVIVIISDSFRADHLGCYGNDWIRTPNLDRFAAESALFTHCYPENIPTGPARRTWFTGKYSFPLPGGQIPDEEDLRLAEYLWDKEFVSAMITDVYHFHKPKSEFMRGFDTVQFIRGQEGDPFVMDESVKVDMKKYHKDRDESERSVKFAGQTEQYLRNRAHWRSQEDYYVAQVVKAGMNWLEAASRKNNNFLWLDIFDPHEPWDPPKEYADLYYPGYEGKEIINPVGGCVEGYLEPEELKRIQALYAGEVTFVDKWIGIFLDYLRNAGFFDDSIIIFTSDHGEPLGDHGFVRKSRMWLYEDLMHTPLMIHTPNCKPIVSPSIAQSTDMMPTILDFFDIEPAPNMDGKSLLPAMKDEEYKIRDYAYCGKFPNAWTIRNAEWNLVIYHADQQPAGSFCPQRKELFNLKDDPNEKNNVIGQHDALAKEMELELQRFVAEICRKY